jgi:hypothetical protein
MNGRRNWQSHASDRQIQIALRLRCRSPRIPSVEPRQQERPWRVIIGMAVIIGIIGVIGVEMAMPVSAARADVGGLQRSSFLHDGWRGQGRRRDGRASEQGGEQQGDDESGCGDPFHHRTHHRTPTPSLRDDPNIPLRSGEHKTGPQRTSVIISFEPSWAAKAAPGLINDSAHARSAGAARAKKCAECCKTQNSRSVYRHSPSVAG